VVRRTTVNRRLPENTDARYELPIFVVLRGSRGHPPERLSRALGQPCLCHLAETSGAATMPKRAGLRTRPRSSVQDPVHIRRFWRHGASGAIIKPVATPRGVELASTAVVSQELLDNEEVWP